MDFLLLIMLLVAAGLSVRNHFARLQEKNNALHLLMAVLLDEDTYQANRQGLQEAARSHRSDEPTQLWMKLLDETDYAAQTSGLDSARLVREKLPELRRRGVAA